MSMVMLALLAAAAAEDGPAETVRCEGVYGGHLQGVARDPEGRLYWSFTTQLVKTDAAGKRLAAVDVPSHHGDLTWHDGRVYVAVNLGKFNRPAGEADSWIYVYDAGDLCLLSKHEAQEAVHGAGGIAQKDGHFFVIGGLPGDYDENYVYEYDGQLGFVRRHVLESGHTHLGVQTVCYGHGAWWFGCYGAPQVLLKADDAFAMLERVEDDWAYGIAPLPGGRFLKGATGFEGDRRHWWGEVTAAAPKETER